MMLLLGTIVCSVLKSVLVRQNLCFALCKSAYVYVFVCICVYLYMCLCVVDCNCFQLRYFFGIHIVFSLLWMLFKYDRLVEIDELLKNVFRRSTTNIQ